MEILLLVLLYSLSQNPDFSESVKPLMERLKSSEEMLRFLKELSSFSEKFSVFQSSKTSPQKEKSASASDKKENPQSPTEGIADAFIQSILDNYFKKGDNT